MNIGASTLCYLDRPLEEAVQELADADFRTIELFADAPSFDPMSATPERIAWLKRFKQERALIYSIHTPCFDLNPASANPGVRRETASQYRRTVELAAELEATLVVVHAGALSDMKLSAASAQAAMYETLGPVVDEAERRRVALGFENTGYGSLGFIRSLDEWLELGLRLGSDRVTYLLDTGHAVLQGIDLGDAVRAIGSRLGQVHVHDNGGTKDDHWPVGGGTIDFRPLLCALSEIGLDDVPLVLEACDADDPRRGLVESRAALLRLAHGIQEESTLGSLRPAS
jgi:sugar phosphate isomerase/epimerase